MRGGKSGLGWFAVALVSLWLAVAAQAQVYEKMFSFADAGADIANKGSRPVSGLVQDGEGNFYGTTLSGGTLGDGTVFKMTPARVVTTLVDFTNTAGNMLGRAPVGDLVRGRDGNFYGTTVSGGTSSAGTVFKMTPAGVLTTLVQFTGTSGGALGSNFFTGFNLSPQARLMEGSDGNFYGMTPAGGASDCGTVFKMTPAGVLTTLLEFTGTSGGFKGKRPLAALVQVGDGSFFGTTEQGGALDFGTVFKLNTDGTPGGTTLTTLVEFAGTDGAYPDGGVVRGSDGSFYGTTSGGAIGFGTVFKMSTDGTPGGTTLMRLVSFTTAQATNKGAFPKAGLVQASDGNLYGTTSGGGFNAEVGGFGGYGTVFKITPGGMLATLVEFTGSSATGTVPDGGLLQAADGNFYGTTARGGGPGLGTVFKMTSGGELTTLAAFDGLNGGDPHDGLLEGSDGNLYGATGFPFVFKLTPSGGLTTLAIFDGTTNKGNAPSCVLVEHSNGDFYGTTIGGGDFLGGTVFKITPTGVLTTLVEFTRDGPQGSNPFAGLVKGGDGNFYGTTERGGVSNFGTVFKMTPAGDLTTLVQFTGGGAPAAPQTFSNATPIAINDGIPSAPYPSSITVAGFSGNAARVRVTLRGLRHTYPDDIRVLLVSPSGRKVELMSGTGGGAAVSNVNLTFADDAAASIPPNFATGTYLPTVNDGSSFPTPAPAAPYATVLTTFFGEPANGAWQLFVHDRYAPADTGGIDEGWSLELTPGDTRGNAPRRLAAGGDGNLYGTTFFGGANGAGTVFKVTPDGTLRTLVDFDGANGSNPSAGLLSDADGSFYGTTTGGGAFGVGTVFRVTVAGVRTTLVEFTGEEDGHPSGGELIRGTDGNLYGTVSPDLSSGGSIYRILFPGAPLVSIAKATPQGADSVIIEGKVNARGAATTVWLQVGTSPGALSSPGTIVATNQPGFQTQLVGATLDGLDPGTIYYYRFHAESSAGSTDTPIASVSTLAKPTVSVVAASPVTPTSARFNGTVNARNFDTTVVFEWGTDGNSFPNTAAATPGSVAGNANATVFADVSGLAPDATYHYRIKATNVAGEATSGQSSFQTLAAPVATVGDAFGLNTVSARVFGSVNAKRSLTDVVFEYGTDGINFPNAVAAMPPTVAGETVVPVSGTLVNLSQGTTYHYRVRATSPGGVGLSATRTFDLAVLSGFTQQRPGALPDSNGSIVVTLTPGGINSGWRFVGEQQWRPSGVAAGGLVTADREVEFRPVPGFLHPLRETVSVISGAATTVLEREYFATSGSGTGGLTLTLKPESLTLAGLPVAQRAQWRFLGEDDSAWRESGATAGALAAGVYLVECKPLAGRTTPPVLSVAVQADATSTAIATYFLADAMTGTSPSVLPFETVTADSNLPYAYVGQIRSDAGAATGFVVKPRVVATAGHVVFDDGQLAYATGLQWLFQRDSAVFEPKPLTPHGSYVFAGYAARRTLENTPGESTPESQQLDAAAIYFLEDAGRGGFGGFLASDAADNEFITSPALKTLVGYPVDGIAPANQGRMHATPAANVSFARVPGTAASGSPFRLYTTGAIRSSGGHSGGPLCVQFEGGAFYPAAIFLGGTGQTVVRAIDSTVIDLFTRAESSANSGGNNSGNAGIPQIVSVGSTSTLTGGGVTVNLNLPDGGWRIGGGAFLAGGATRSNLAPGTYVVNFKPVSGYSTPESQEVAVSSGQVATRAANYALIARPGLGGATIARGATGIPFSYQPDLTGSVDSVAVSVSGNETLAGLGLSLNTANGRVSGTPLKTGAYSFIFTASNAGGTSDPFAVALDLVMPGTLRVAVDGAGSVKAADFLGETMQVPGNAYTLTAKPERGFVFVAWRGTSTDAAGAVTAIGSDEFQLDFTMSQAVELTASFIPNPFPAVDGAFAGLLTDSGTPVGALVLKLTSSGRVTGSIKIGGASYKFKGTMSGGGRIRAEIARKNDTPVVLEGVLDFAAVPSRIAGTVTIDGTTLDFVALHAFESVARVPNPFAGKYALALPRPAVGAQGHGYGTFAVKTNGAVRLIGALGDGEKLSAAGVLADDGTWALYAEPYRKAGLAAGTLTFHDDAIAFLDGDLVWKDASAVTATIATQGSHIVPLTLPYDATLSFSADGISALLSTAASLDAANRFTLTPADATTLLLNSKTGALSGKFPDGGPKPLPFKGVLLPKQRTGFGQYPNGATTGAVELTRVP